MAQQETSAQRATDTEVEMVRARLRIAAEIDRLDDLSDQQPDSPLASFPALVRMAEALRAGAEQAAHTRKCPLLWQLVEEDRPQRP